ncbi:nucleotide sugar dehydrogenase [Planococcus rifietoensis]|uniref:nucleotide sugar dehydrogenase n=1 Tax=Planococcus rifietoensis TaxID=200991 RepID=UPI00384B5318
MINVIGLGYIGLPTALMLAKSGHKVVGTDYNRSITETLNQRKLPFEENGLEELFASAIDNNIEFTNDYVESSIYILAVPTPYMEKNKKLDPSFVISAINSVLNVCQKGSLIIIESTVSPGTIDKYIRPEIDKRNINIGTDIHLVHAPERIIPGNMIFELEHNSRTIGADHPTIGEKVKEIYGSFCKGDIIITDIKSAEMSKVVENTYRDINIAFANELAKICREDNLDVYEIIKIANNHPRVNILQPGPGVGGHCISVDPWFLVGDYPDLTKLILTARKTNDSMPSHVISRIYEIMKENKIESIDKVGLYGMSYKENVDDVRESPTLQLLDVLEKNFSKGIKVFDPYSKEAFSENHLLNFDDFINEIDLVVIMVGHKHILDNLACLKGKIILDTKNIYNKDAYKL